ncbi:PI-PLC domain-containing protein [Brevundimonas goettingensis]|jgi:hypothetical protein|uniref:Phosphodiesterase n=1 Tax=Brevundimonas goettingensis TaxID=2774190 RepID=A0A975C1H7_9CAUL|nr:hypothetical protein [Brevundimonas goettingensis]QTC91172.1 phosphodiesterase [Brevundimonas goettingensis]
MIILSHRGFWRTPDEKNRPVAFERTVAEAFGTETDVRDLVGDLVVSHDPALTGAQPWSEVLDLFEGKGLPLAVNVKSDGLSDALARAFAGRDIDWFAFDMSGPETLRYATASLPFLTRHSDIETTPILYDQAAGVWLDSFGPIWFDRSVIETHLAAGKRVCVVSPELHGRDPDTLWPLLKGFSDTEGQLMLCTDRPDLARSHFA